VQSSEKRFENIELRHNTELTVAHLVVVVAVLVHLREGLVQSEDLHALQVDAEAAGGVGVVVVGRVHLQSMCETPEYNSVYQYCVESFRLRVSRACLGKPSVVSSKTVEEKQQQQQQQTTTSAAIQVRVWSPLFHLCAELAE
jgi:hypothetical protein